MMVLGKDCEIRRGNRGYYLYNCDDLEPFTHPMLNLEEIAITHGWLSAEGGVFPWIKDEESIMQFIQLLNNEMEFWNYKIEGIAGKEIWEKVKNENSRRRM